MIVPGLSLDEEARLAALEACDILDTLPEAAFEDLVEIAHRVCGTPVAAISFIDAKRQWFKASRGLGDMTEMPREHAFCHHTIQGGGTLMVQDAASDPRFTDNPFVTRDDGVRFYAGVPVVTEEGARVGTLCVLDRERRQLEPTQLALLEMLARQVGAQIALRRTRAALQDALAAQEGESRGLALVVAMQRAAVEAPDLPAALSSMVARAAEALGFDGGGVWRTPAGGGTSLEAAGPYTATGTRLAPFVEATRATAFSRELGAPGAAWRTGAPIWLAGFIEEPSVPRLTAALAAGLSCGVVVPVRLRGEVVAVFELVSVRARSRDDATMALLALAADEIASWIAASTRA